MAPSPLLLLLLLTCAACATAARQSLVANKCCPLGQTLTYSSPLACASPNQSDSAGGRRTDTVSALLSRYPTGLLPWMDPKVKVYDESSLEPTGGVLLAGQPAGAYVRYGAHPLCAESDRQVIPVSATYRYKLLSSGRLLVNLSTWGGVGEVRLGPDDYCTDRLEKYPNMNGTFVIVACPCNRVVCVRKCCQPKMAFAERLSFGECGAPTRKEEAALSSGGLIWRPRFLNPDFSLAPTPTYHLVGGAGHRLDCGENGSAVMLNTDEREGNKMWVFANGSALLDNFGFGVPFASDRWCGETTFTENGSVVENAVFCLSYSTAEPVPAGVQTLGALFLLGAFFLMLTLCVYGLLPELRAPAHAKALMCHSGALLVGSLTLGCMQLTSTVPELLCDVGAVIIQFSFLATFFWLNVLCIDISWAFSGLRGLLGSLLDTSRKKFLYYSLYAWGSPMVITAVTVGIHIGYKNGTLPQWVLPPSIGGKNCWFYGAAAHWAYFYGPMAVLLATNSALFVFTAGRLACAHCDAAELNRGDSVRHDRSSRMSTEKRRLILYTKLFLLMGVTWLLEVVSWSVHQDEDSNSGDEWWMFIDVINTLRGLFIFIIFCCKGKVLRMLRKRLGAWGLPGGLPPGAERSPTYRSQVSTRQSSLLQLTPSGEDSFWWQRRPSAPQPPPPAAAVKTAPSPPAVGAVNGGYVSPLEEMVRRASSDSLGKRNEAEIQKPPST